MKAWIKYSFPILCIVHSSCATLKPHERVFVNDPEMQMQLSSEQRFSYYVLSIREGSITPQTTKGSGGCGCN